MPAPLIEFPADDPYRARRFWHGVLGVTLAPRPAAEGSGWQTDTDGLRLGVHERGPGPGDTASLPYFSVADLAATVENVRELGGSVLDFRRSVGGVPGTPRATRSRWPPRPHPGSSERRRQWRRIEPMLLEGAQLDAPAAPLNDLLRVGLDAAPDEVAIVSAVRALSWRELDRASAALAGGYRGLGLEPGDRVASLMPNRIDLVVHYLACFRAGLIATPLNYRYTAREIDHALEVSGARALLAHVERAEDVAASELAGDLELGAIAYRDAEPLPTGNDEPPGWTAVGATTSPRCSAPSPLRAREEQPDPEAPAAIFFTSGSTGPAKGVTHSRETLRWMFASAAAAFELDASDVFLPGSSMSHVGSFLWTLATLSVGGKVVVARSTDAHELLPLLREQQPTVLAMIPAALSALIHDHDLQPGDFSSLRICRAGADKVSTELLTEFAAAAGFPIVEGYGMTEVGLGDPESALGRDQAGLDRDADPRLHHRAARRAGRADRGGRGGPDLDPQPQPHARLLAGARGDRGGGDRRLARLGRPRPGRRGRLPLVLRPQEAGDRPRRLQHQPATRSRARWSSTRRSTLAGAVGVHDEVHGENVRAYVTLSEGAEPPSRADLIVFCRERIGYKAPEEIVFLDEMPLNPTGKIDRVGLKRMAEDHLHPHGLSR